MSKTPREGITDFLDASKTQTINTSRTRRGGLVRTPDVPANRSGQGLSRAPQSTRQSPNVRDSLKGRQKLLTPEVFLSSPGLRNRPQHDRVSSLKGKRRSLSSMDGIETPRQLIEGFIEANDTTAPIVRYSSRISDGRVSASQPAIPVAARFSTGSRGDFTREFDLDTPRTMIQNYMINTSGVAETPLPPSGASQTSNRDLSPEIQGIREANTSYHTPSPFKDSSPGSDVLSAVRSPHGKTPRSVRSKRGKFNATVGEFINQTADVSVIPATNPEDYQVPSPFQSSSDEESFVPDSQPSRHIYNKSRIRKGKFDITVPSPMREEISRYRNSQRENITNIALSQNQEHDYEDHRSSDEENYADSRASQRSKRYTDQENMEGDKDEEIDGDFNHADSRASKRSNRYVDAENRESDENEEMDRDFNYADSMASQRSRRYLESENREPDENEDRDGDYNYADSRASQRSRRYVDAENREPDENEERDGDYSYADSRASQRSRRYVDAENREPDENKERDDDFNLSPSRPIRRSDGPGVSLLPPGNEYEYTLPLKGNTDDFNSSDDVGDRMSRSQQRRSGGRRLSDASRLSSSSMEMSPIISDKGNQLEHLEREYRHSRDFVKAGRWSEGHVSRFGSPGENKKSGRHSEGQRSFQGQMDIDQFFSRRRAQSVQSYYQSEGAIGDGRKSAENLRQGDRNESVRLSYSTHEQTENLSRRSSRTPMVTEPDKEIYYAQRLQKSQAENKNSRSMSPLQTMTPSPIVSPSSRSNSTVWTPNRCDLKPSKRRSHTPQQSTSARQLTPSNSEKSRSNILLSESPKIRSPLQTVTPSPVVSSGSNSMAETLSSSGVNKSKKMSHTPVQSETVSHHGHSKLVAQRSEGSRTSMGKSRSEVKDTERSLAASPVLASRRLAKGMVNAVPNSTVNFSPVVASTQNIATISKPPAVQDDVADQDDGENEQDVDNQMDVEEHDWEAVPSTSTKQKAPAAAKPKPKPRKPRQKDKYTIPTSIVKKQYTHYAGMRVDKDAITEVMEISEVYWDNLCKDLEAYALHAGRKKITMEDFALLFRRQGLTNDKVSLKSLIEQYLPMEEREKLIHVARAGNRLDPKI